MNLIDWLLGLAQFVLGFLFGAIVTGLFTVYVVLPAVMHNKEVQELQKLFREAKEYLAKILENQEEKKD
jgi:uncharacterized membrane protein (DUF106 family)